MNIEKEYDDEKAIQDIGNGKNLHKPISYVYNCHYKGIERYILKNNGNPFDAEDIFQETLMVTIKAIKENKFRAEASLKSYVYAVAKNLWITELRRRKSSSKRAEIFSSEQESVQEGVNKKLIQTENLKLIMNLFESLGGRCKQLLLLYYYQDMSMKEIMEEENYTSEQVVRNKKYKCLKALTDRIKTDPIAYKNFKDALKYG
jgi:RNA polymerase sigma factor (sigma-70 family)